MHPAPWRCCRGAPAPCIERRASRREFDDIDLVAAAEQVSQQGERCSDRFFQQVHEHLPDDGADPELRIIQAAGDRQVKVDHAIAVLQQRDGQFQRQIHGIGTFDLVAQLQLVDDNVVAGGELAVLDVVFQIHRQFALGDLVAREVSRVRRDLGQVDASIAHADVGIGRLRQQIGLAPDVRRRIAVD